MGLGSAGPGVAEVVVVSACGGNREGGLASYMARWLERLLINIWGFAIGNSLYNIGCYKKLGKVGDRGSHSSSYHINCRPGLGSWFVAPFMLLIKDGHLVWGDKKPHSLYLNPSSMITLWASANYLISLTPVFPSLNGG